MPKYQPGWAPEFHGGVDAPKWWSLVEGSLPPIKPNKFGEIVNEDTAVAVASPVSRKVKRIVVREF